MNIPEKIVFWRLMDTFMMTKIKKNNNITNQIAMLRLQHKAVFSAVYASVIIIY